MSYLKTIDNSHINSSNETIATCDDCGKEFPTQHPHYSVKKKNFHLCDDCMEKIAEWFISNNFGYPGLFWLKAMENKHYSRDKKKRNCYLPKNIKKEILQKYKFTCQECGTKEKLSIDHIKPVIKGGTDDFNNLTVLCRSCNSKKGSKYEN